MNIEQNNANICTETNVSNKNNYMNNIKEEDLMKQIMALDFYIIDLQLYMDTHPWDCRAILAYNNTVYKSNMYRNAYERMYGPINVNLSPVKCPWQWTMNPFPWEDA